jgi:hypothetical protein
MIPISSTHTDGRNFDSHAASCIHEEEDGRGSRYEGGET